MAHFPDSKVPALILPLGMQARDLSVSFCQYEYVADGVVYACDCKPETQKLDRCSLHLGQGAAVRSESESRKISLLEWARIHYGKHTVVASEQARARAEEVAREQAQADRFAARMCAAPKKVAREERPPMSPAGRAIWDVITEG